MNINSIKFIVQLKNAALSQKEQLTVEYSTFILKLLKILYKEGFVQSFCIKFNKEKNKDEFLISLRYFYNQPILKDLKFVSTPSYSHYLKLKSISKLANKKKVLIFSTSKGILNSFECKKQKVGGNLLFIC